MLTHIKKSDLVTISLSLLLGFIFFLSPFNIFLYIALTILVASISTIEPDIGIYLILFSIPFSKKIEIQKILISTLDIIFMMSFIGFTINRILQKKRLIYKTPLTAPFLLLILFLILSVIRAQGKFAGFRQFVKYSEMFLFFIYLINVIDSNKRLYRFVSFSTAIAILVAATRLLCQIDKLPLLFVDKAFASAIIKFDRLFFNNYTLETAFLNLIIFFPFFIYLTSVKFGSRLLSLSAFLILSIAVLFIFSRAGLMGSIGGFLVTMSLSTRYDSKSPIFKNMLILIFIVALLVSYSYKQLADDRFLYKLDSTYHIFTNIVKDDLEQSNEISFKRRIDIIKFALKNIKEHPFFGMGAGNYIHLHFGPQYLGKDQMPGIHHVHNLYLQIWMEMGTFAIVSYLWLIFRYFGSSLAMLRRYENTACLPLILGSLGGIASFSIHSLMDFMFLHHVQLFFIFALAIPYMIGEERRACNSPF